jgi:hypothetical protein
MLVSGACAADGEAGRSVVRDSAGIRIAVGPAVDVPLSWHIEKVREVALPDAGVTPPPWMIAADPDARRAFVVDRAEPRIHVIDTTGSVVSSFGRAGRGPHEMAAPVAIEAENGSVIVADALRQLLIRWTLDGEPVEEMPLPQPYWGPGFAVDHEAVVLIRSASDNANPTELGQELIRAAGDNVQVLASLPQRMTMVDLPCMRRPVPKAFAASILWTAAGSRVHHIVWPEYRVDIHDAGVLVGSVRRDIAPREVTDSMAVNEIQTGQLRALIRMCGMSAEDLLREIGAEPFASPVTWLAVDPGGRLWVWRSSGGTQQVDVFDENGGYLGTKADVPMPVAFLTDDLMLAVRNPWESAVLELWRIDRTM